MLEQKTQPYPRTGGAQGKTLCQAPSLPCCSPGVQKICLVLELGQRWQGVQGRGGSCPPQQVEGAEQGPGAQQRATGWLVTQLWSASPPTNTHAGQHNSCVTENDKRHTAAFAPRRGAAATRGAVREELGPEGTCTHGAAGTCGQEPSFCADPRARRTAAAARSQRGGTQPVETGSRQQAERPVHQFPHGCRRQRQTRPPCLVSPGSREGARARVHPPPVWEMPDPDSLLISKSSSS